MKSYFLPQIQCLEEIRTIEKQDLSLPKLEASQITEIANHLRAAQKIFLNISIFEIVDCIAIASEQWRDTHHPFRRKAETILPTVCGLSKEMVSLILDDVFKELTEEKLLHLLEAELGDATILDRFCKKNSGSTRTRAFGPGLITQILPGNVLGVSVVSLICGLLVKSANLLRVSHSEVVLTTLFAESLQEISPEIAETIAILTWDKKETSITKTAFQKSDLVIAYGSDESIATIQTLMPSNTPRILHGHKLSFGIISRENISKNLSKKVAMDIALYDQQGCLSPHLYYVESDGKSTPLDFAEQVAESLQILSKKFPKGLCDESTASQIQQLRGTLPLKGGSVFESPNNTDWTVLFDPSPEFTLSPLSRCVWIKSVGDLSEIPPLLSSVRNDIQAIGIAIPKTRADTMIENLSLIGGCRICPIGKMQRPPLNWMHDGKKRLLPLLRFVNWE
ncbi:MAG: hypothetical protein GXO96_03085 [Nitrospirae bacterium]|nr:hypothetical protein [Candidatus Manganitrophaceae bacterium]